MFGSLNSSEVGSPIVSSSNLHRSCFTPMWKFMKRKGAENRAIQQSQPQTAFESAEKEAALYNSASSLSQLPKLAPASSDTSFPAKEQKLSVKLLASATRFRKTPVCDSVNFRASLRQPSPKRTRTQERSTVINQRLSSEGQNKWSRSQSKKWLKSGLEGYNDVLQIISENQENP